MWRSRPSRLPAGQGYRTRSCKGWCHPGECILRPEYSLHDSNVNVTFWQVNHEDWPRTSALDPMLPLDSVRFQASEPRNIPSNDSHELATCLASEADMPTNGRQTMRSEEHTS